MENIYSKSVLQKRNKESDGGVWIISTKLRRISDFSVMLCTTFLGKYPNEAEPKPGDLAQHCSQFSTVTHDIFLAGTSHVFHTSSLEAGTTAKLGPDPAAQLTLADRN